MEANTCLGCRFSSVKVNIAVPEKYDIKKFAKETNKFTSKLSAKNRHKKIHYALVFDSEHQKSASLDFTVDCQCILNIEKQDCSNYSHTDNLRVKHINPGPQSNQLPKLGVTQRIWRL